jgi:2-polyprenyl-6-methoxyphenol hydroxylase-like FAD-dependent oxidoreductase
MKESRTRSARSPARRPRQGQPAAAKRGSRRGQATPRLRALIVGGGIGGLAAAVALRRVGIDAAVYEKAPQIAEVGAGLSLWSNAVIALRRLGLEAPALAAGSAFERVQTLLSDGRPFPSFDLAELAQRAGAPCICIHRAALQRILLEALTEDGGKVVATARECVGFEEAPQGVVARFAGGTTARGDILIGADGIHSAVRAGLFGERPPRYAGYVAWRAIVHGARRLLPEGEGLAVVARGSHAGCFHCGGDDLYWFATRNAKARSHPGADGDKAEVLRLVAEWAVPFRPIVEATDEHAILRNEIVDRPAAKAWGAGRVTLLGDAIHATTPNLGQGACQALEDAVFLADCLRRAASPEAGLRDYEARRRERTSMVITESWRLGKMIQMANPAGTWLRNRLATTAWARRRNERLLERLLCYDLPVLETVSTG